jgi:polar amino acid transport system substrate-binding protein
MTLRIERRQDMRPRAFILAIEILAIGALSLLAVPALAQTCTPKVDASHLIEAGKLMMSVNPTLPPQQFVNEKGELQGLNVEMGKDIARRLCLEAVFVRMDFPAMIPALKAARFDGIDTGLFFTEERSKMMYLIPHAQQALSVFVPTGSTLKIGKVEDLGGHIVGVESATNNERKLKEANDAWVARGGKPADIRSFKTATETVAALRAGQLEAAVNIDETATDLEKRGGVKVLLRGLNGTPITFAFRDKAVAEAAAEAITAMKADGTYDKLFDQFGMTRLSDKVFKIVGPGPS